MDFTAVLLVYGIFLTSVNCERAYQRKHFFQLLKRSTDCNGGTITLKEGVISSARSTTKTMKESADEDNPTLLSAYNEMIRENDYNDGLEKAQRMGLSKDEFEAVRLYTMDTDVYSDLNTAMRDGNELYNNYAAMHYWLGKGLNRLPKRGGYLYRGLKKTVEVDVGTSLYLPGFTSTSTQISVAEVNTEHGCTMMRFDGSDEGGYVADISAFPKEYEVTIPPTEKFTVYKREDKDGYQYIYLKPTSSGNPSNPQTGGKSRHTFSPLLLVVVIMRGFIVLVPTLKKLI